MGKLIKSRVRGFQNQQKITEKSIQKSSQKMSRKNIEKQRYFGAQKPFKMRSKIQKILSKKMIGKYVQQGLKSPSGPGGEGKSPMQH